jgi:hypothetical protein
MPDEWFYVKDKKKQGPISFAQLRELVATGEIGRADMLLQGGTTKWLAAETVAGLFPEAPVEGPAEPPPDLEVFAEAAAATERVKPHQGQLIWALGLASVGTGALGLLGAMLVLFWPGWYPLAVFALFAAGVGLPVYFKAVNDLRRMRSGHVDPAGEPQTQQGQMFALAGGILGAVSLAVLAVKILIYLVTKYFF